MAKRGRTESLMGAKVDPPSLRHRMTPEEAAEWRALRASHGQACEIATAILAGWVLAYKNGEITLEVLARGLVSTCDVLPEGFGWEVPGGRSRLIGDALRVALMSSPGRRGRKNGFPETFKRMAAAFVTYAHEPPLSLPINRSTSSRPRKRSETLLGPKKTAFEYVADYFHRAGVRSVTPTKVERWYGKYATSANVADEA